MRVFFFSSRRRHTRCALVTGVQTCARPISSRYNYVSNLPADATLKMLAATIKARWICEQAHQQLKEELGLDHFEGRSWVGLHRHALMTMIAYAFLQARRLKAAGRKKKSRGADATTRQATPPEEAR